MSLLWLGGERTLRPASPVGESLVEAKMKASLPPTFSFKKLELLWSARGAPSGSWLSPGASPDGALLPA